MLAFVSHSVGNVVREKWRIQDEIFFRKNLKIRGKSLILEFLKRMRILEKAISIYLMRLCSLKEFSLVFTAAWSVRNVVISKKNSNHAE